MDHFNFWNTLWGSFLGLGWFISMAVDTIRQFMGSYSMRSIFHGVFYLAYIVPAMLVAIPYIFKNIDKIKKDRVSWMPAFWLVTAYYGTFFHHVREFKWPVFMGYFLWVLIASYVFYWIWCVWKNKDFRTFTIMLGLINFYFMMFVAFCSAMSISGEWL